MTPLTLAGVVNWLLMPPTRASALMFWIAARARSTVK